MCASSLRVLVTCPHPFKIGSINKLTPSSVHCNCCMCVASDYENPPSMAGAGAPAGQRLQTQASDERSASPPLPPPPPEMVRSVDDLATSAGFPAPPTPGLISGPAQGQNQNEFAPAPGLMPPPGAGGAGGRQSWIAQQQRQQQELMGIEGSAVAGFRQSQQRAQQQLAFLQQQQQFLQEQQQQQFLQEQQQQQLLQEQAAAVGVTSPVAQQLAGPWKTRSPRDPEWAPLQYLEKVLFVSLLEKFVQECSDVITYITFYCTYQFIVLC